MGNAVTKEKLYNVYLVSLNHIYENRFYNGMGVVYHDNGQIKYIGNFRNGKYHGEFGKLYDKDGNYIFMGDFCNGEPTGKNMFV